MVRINNTVKQSVSDLGQMVSNLYMVQLVKAVGDLKRLWNILRGAMSVNLAV